MKYNTNIPIYIQIATDIKEQIMSEKLKDGEKLPSIRELSLIYDVSALTAQRAAQQMELEGIIETRKGIGSFVVDQCKSKIEKQMVENQAHDFIAHMRKMGLSDQAIQDLIREELNRG